MSCENLEFKNKLCRSFQHVTHKTSKNQPKPQIQPSRCTLRNRYKHVYHQVFYDWDAIFTSSKHGDDKSPVCSAMEAQVKIPRGASHFLAYANGPGRLSWFSVLPGGPRTNGWEKDEENTYGMSYLCLMSLVSGVLPVWG